MCSHWHRCSKRPSLSLLAKESNSFILRGVIDVYVFLPMTLLDVLVGSHTIYLLLTITSVADFLVSVLNR